jgi:ribosomal protein S18 acetylase RimI-like enzyme
MEKQFGEEAFSLGTFKRFLKERRTFLVLLVDSKVSGYSVVYVRKGSNVARLYSICIAKDYQGKGLGVSFLNAIENLCREQGYEKMSLEVSLQNWIAKRLYRKMGYSAVKLLEGYYHDSDGVRMEKPLSP